MDDLFVAMGIHPALGSKPVVMGGLRHEYHYAERDARCEPDEGWTDTWVEKATWTRVDASSRERS